MWALLEKDAFSSFLFILFDSDIMTKLWKFICSLIRHFNAASFTTSASCRGLPPAMTKLHLQWFRRSKDMSHTSAAIFFYSSVHSSVASWNEPSSSCIFMQSHGVLFKCICIHIQHFRASVSATSSVTSASSAALLKKALQNKNEISNVSTTCVHTSISALFSLERLFYKCANDLIQHFRELFQPSLQLPSVLQPLYVLQLKGAVDSLVQHFRNHFNFSCF